MENDDLKIRSNDCGLTGNRWLVAAMGSLLQVTLGTIYAWSYFQKPLMGYAGWSNQQVAWILSLAICFLGLAAAVGGVLMPKVGPRRLALGGVLLYAVGWCLGGLALSLKSLPLLYLGLGVVGGIGLGLGYVTPVATVAKWFPDKKGLVTGMVVMGFGFGALLMSKVMAPLLLILCRVTKDGVTVVNWPMMFFMIAFVLGITGILAASFMRNPPAQDIAAGSTVSDIVSGSGNSGRAFSRIMSRRFLVMFFVFFCNITAGIMFIGFQSPLLQDLLKEHNPGLSAVALSAAGATLIGISSLFNGIGRLFWGGLSDRYGRIQIFRCILGSQLLVFVALMFVKSPLLFGVLVCYVLLCYGGGFGTMPSFVLTVFGPAMMGVVYGFMLIAWSLAGLVGPQVVAFVKDSFSPVEAASYTFMVGAVLLLAGFVASFVADNSSFESEGVARK